MPSLFGLGTFIHWYKEIAFIKADPMKDLRVVITFPYILSILKEERRKWDNLTGTTLSGSGMNGE